MFAVMKTGGKQYKVTSGDVLRVEKLAADAGETVQFNEILMIGANVGAPLVDGAAVQAEVIDQIKGEKTINFVKRRRKHSSKRTKGHRQQLTLLRVTELLEKGADKTGVKAAIGAGSISVAAVVAAAPAAKKATPKKAAAPKVAKVEAKADAATGSKPSNLLTEARGGKADDLKKISGVGPKMVGLLHENGVFHFDQILGWGAEEIAYMDDKLSSKGRIERDDWVAQATQFAAEQE